MNILLHVCCAPCLIYPLEALRSKEHNVAGFFYNPNIHPQTEYISRRQAAEEYAAFAGCRLDVPEYAPEHFFQAVHLRQVPPDRCMRCWSLRLRQTARHAKESGFDAFCTTLLVSPYQDQAQLKMLGEDIASSEGSVFYYEDFRPGFRKAHAQARAQGIYCQKYCGCLYSQKERSVQRKT